MLSDWMISRMQGILKEQMTKKIVKSESQKWEKWLASKEAFLSSIFTKKIAADGG